MAKGRLNAGGGCIGGRGAGPGHGRRAAPAADPGPVAGAGAEHFKKSHRQQTLEARYLTDAGPMSCDRIINAERGHCPVLRVPARGIMRGKRGSSGWRTSKRRPVKRRWSRPLGSTSAATAPAGCKSRCAITGTGWVGSACTRPCAAGPACAATESVRSAHDRLHARIALCPQPVAEPPQAYSSTATALAPGRAPSTTATRVGNCSTTTQPCAR